MGVVYLAAKGADRVALKVVRGSFLDDPSLRSRFLREVSTLRKINHPNVAKVLDSDTDDEIAWLAIEYVNGADLKTIVEDKGPLSEARWFDLASGLLQALVAVHAEGVVHRDIKPANVLIEADHPKLIDFGISQISDETSITTTGLVAGSPAWLAPEQLEGGELSPAADMFSLGSLLVYAATGQSPWGETSTMPVPVIFNKILNSQPDISGLTVAQQALVEPLLRSNPAERPTATKALSLIGVAQAEPSRAERQEPEEVEERQRVGDHREEGPLPPVVTGSDSGRWKIALVSVSLILAVFVVWILQLQSTDSPETSPSSGASASGPLVPGADITLKVGSLMPVTGSLAFLSPPAEAGILLAVQEINDSGSGVRIDLLWGDSGDYSNPLYESEVPRFIDSGVQAIIGPLSGAVTLQVIDQVTESGVMLISPGVQDTYLSDNSGLFFRTVASDAQLVQMMANEMALDGRQTLAVITENESWFTEWIAILKEAFEATGGRVVADETFEYGDTDFSRQVRQIATARPDAVVVLGFDETADIVTELRQAGIPSDAFYFSDWNLSDYSSELEKGALTGAKGFQPSQNPWVYPPGFTDRLDEAWTGLGSEPLTDYLYAAESYDAVISLALAAFAAQSNSPAVIAAQMSEISGYSGRGTKCFSFLECAEIISQGLVADYDGPSGGIAFGPNGDATEAPGAVYIYDEDNAFWLEE
jgi:branched-chain amino acid transport system substrate-binding protein